MCPQKSSKGCDLMNYEMIKLAKQVLGHVTDVCETLQDKGWIELNSSSLRMKDILLHDVSEYILYIIAADGSINIHEVEVFRYITEYGGDTVSSLKEYIEESNVQSYSFQSEPPFSLRLLVDATNSYLRANPDADDLVRNTYEQYIMLFGIVGKETMEADQSVPFNERNKFVTYLRTIKQYIDEYSYVTPEGQYLNLLEKI